MISMPHVAEYAFMYRNGIHICTTTGELTCPVHKIHLMFVIISFWNVVVNKFIRSRQEESLHKARDPSSVTSSP